MQVLETTQFTKQSISLLVCVGSWCSQRYTCGILLLRLTPNKVLNQSELKGNNQLLFHLTLLLLFHQHFLSRPCLNHLLSQKFNKPQYYLWCRGQCHGLYCVPALVQVWMTGFFFPLPQTVGEKLQELEVLKQTSFKHEILWLIQMSTASGLRGCWFKTQLGLQDWYVEGSGIGGRISGGGPPRVREGEQSGLCMLRR